MGAPQVGILGLSGPDPSWQLNSDGQRKKQFDYSTEKFRCMRHAAHAARESVKRTIEMYFHILEPAADIDVLQRQFHFVGPLANSIFIIFRDITIGPLHTQSTQHLNMAPN